MERIKKFKHLLLPLIIAILVFFVPFFWLKPGEMDLGGDNSRLYFYDPIAYLISQSLYSVSHSGLGGENLSYFGIPFFLLLAFVKSLVHSPTILIVIFHGLNLSIGFVSCYLVVKELLKREEETAKQNQLIIEASSILAGLYYTFSPNPIGWWGYQLLPMNVVFLNPLLFFLLLRFFLTGSMRDVFISLLITFLFSPNFSFIGAPTFFSFFPLAVLFLFIYIKFIKKRRIPVIKIAVALLLFVLLQAFHLVPQIASILTPGSFANEFIFGDQGKLGWGLKYFIATAPSIKVSYAMLGLPQYVESQNFWWVYMSFPLLFVFGLLWNRSKLYLLSAIFFLITLFFVSANITHIGLKLYILAFRLPGFSMFRVFYGQWQWAYLFFYILLVGLATATVLKKIKAIQRFVLIGCIVSLLLVTSWPFITAKLTDTTLWQSKGIRSHIEMDPVYEEALDFIRSLPIDGKILSLPLNDHGYQILKGKNNAAYLGPSTITYLAARNEFTSNAELGIFGPRLLTAVRDGDYPIIRDTLSMMNIKYIFYNDDPYIYLDNFPNFPYSQVRNFFPDTQAGYREFISSLGVKEIRTIGDKYHIYEFDDSAYIPHIYTAEKIIYWNDILVADVHAPLSFYAEDTRVALYDDRAIFAKYVMMFDDVLLKARNTSPIFDFFKKKKEDKFVSPTISRKLSSFIYPLVVLKEKRDLARFPIINNAYIDRSIYFAEKRINELAKLEHVPLRRSTDSITKLGSTWVEPKLWEFTRYSEYNSWEITLVRYQKAIGRLVDELEKTKQSDYSTITSKVELKSYLKEHKDDLRGAIRQETLWSTEDRKYISSLVERMFTDIYIKLNLQLPDLNNIPYSVEYPLEDGTYEVYVNKEDIKNLDITLIVDGQRMIPKASKGSEWVRFDDINVQNKPSLPIVIAMEEVPNLTEQTNWKTSEQTTLQDPVTLAIPYNFLGNTSGLVRDIPGWKEDTIYSISFDYLTYDQNFSMILQEKGGTKTNQYLNATYEETFRSTDWKKLSTVVFSAKNAQSAYLQIVKAQDDYENLDSRNIKKIEIKNLSVQKIYDPKIVLKKLTGSKESSNTQITFRRINPAKYVVSVRGATTPYTLVLSQAFNQKWKLFLPSREQEAKTLKGMFARFMGNLLKIITKSIISVSAPEDLRVVASYADGSLQEGIHKSVFLDANTFETWGQDPIAEATHLPVNGYANSWYIVPKDVQNQNDYTLIIEMTTQKFFYGGAIVSVLMFVVIILALGWMRLVKR